MSDGITDEEVKALLNASLDQQETVPTKKNENIFERARTDDAETFAKFFEARVKSRTAFSTVLNIPQDFK